MNTDDRLEKIIRAIRVGATSVEIPRAAAEKRLFEALEVYRTPVEESLEDGNDIANLSDYKKVHSMNEALQIVGKLTWRDYVTERLMFSFAAGSPEVLRDRLVLLVSLIVRWIADLELRMDSKKGGMA